MTLKRQNRRQLTALLAAYVIDRPLEHLSFAGIARDCEVTVWALRYNFEDIDGLLRAVALHVTEKVTEMARCDAPVESSVNDTIGHYARFVADLVQSSEFRDMMLIMLRNSARISWLTRFYEERIVKSVCATLESRVQLAGKVHGLPVLLKEGAARRFYHRIEAAFGLARLLPCPMDLEPEEADRMLRQIVTETFAATYVFQWEPADAA